MMVRARDMEGPLELFLLFHLPVVPTYLPPYLPLTHSLASLLTPPLPIPGAASPVLMGHAQSRVKASSDNFGSVWALLTRAPCVMVPPLGGGRLQQHTAQHMPQHLP